MKMYKAKLTNEMKLKKYLAKVEAKKKRKNNSEKA
jgi:hypothetical protein|tara:strand:- start:1734 stop:1838 length:105 start_codon:yes stop_codon:yes gene_type:complete